MHVIGVVAEYNPFHNGHLYQIKEIKKRYSDSIIVLVISSCFMQRGEASIINRWNKTRIALDYGVSLVVELPFVYASSSSDFFAKGSMEILNYLGVDTLIFGSECNDISRLKFLADVEVNNKEVSILLKKYLDMGYNYPTSLNRALEDITNIRIDKPNDLLALSYIKEIIRNKYDIDVVSIKRTNDYHDSDINSDIVSASTIRKLICDDVDVDRYVPYNINNYLENIDMDKYFYLLKYQIINNLDKLDRFQTVDEGIEMRIIKYIDTVSNVDDLIFKVKSKRYTYNKIRRMFSHILCGFTKEEAKVAKIDYIRVLGFDELGRKYLNSIKAKVNIPITSKYVTGKYLTFDIERRVSNIYSLLIGNNKDNFLNDEMKNKPIIKK